MQQDLENVKRAMTLAIADADRSIQTLKHCRDMLAEIVESLEATLPPQPETPDGLWDGSLWSITVNGTEYVTPYYLSSRVESDWAEITFSRPDKMVVHHEVGANMARVFENCIKLNLIARYVDVSPERQQRVIRSR